MYNFNREEYMNSEIVTIKALIGTHLISNWNDLSKSQHSTHIEQSIQIMDAIQQNKVLKHLVFEDVYIGQCNVDAIISIIKEKNLVSCKIDVMGCSYETSKLIADCAVKFYRTNFTFCGGMIGEYTESDLKKALNKEPVSYYNTHSSYVAARGGICSKQRIRQTLLEAMAENNHLNNHLNNSWEETKLLWLAAKYDTNSTLYYDHIGVPEEIIHNIAKQSFLNKLG